MEQIKTVILCGGKGSRLGEKTEVVPKPLINVCGKPIISHIMANYKHFSFNDFVLCLGYKGQQIQDYFSDNKEYNIEYSDTGIETGTGGRLLKVEEIVTDTFFMTYGDGLSNVNIEKLLDFHISHGKIATVTAVRPLVRFGLLELEGDNVFSFSKHRIPTQGRIDGGFFVFNKRIFEYLREINDTDMLEGKPLENLASDGQFMAYRHDDYWQCIDTKRDLDQASKDFSSDYNWKL